MNRPTHKELTRKIKAARQAVKARRLMLIHPAVIAADALELGVMIDTDLHSVLLQILGIASPKCYAGGRPPARSYASQVLAHDLYAFVVKISRFSSPVYIKFVIQDDEFWLISFHANRTPKG